MNYQTPGPYVPYMSYPYGTYIAAGPPSPPASVCSEFIYQNSLPDGRCASPGIQMNTQKIQLLNTTVVDARRRKNMMARLPSRVESPMMNFFQGGMPFSDKFSDVEESSIQGGSISPQYCFTSPYHLQQVAPFCFQYPVNNSLVGQPQPYELGQYQQRNIQRTVQQKHDVQKPKQEISELSSNTKGCSEIFASEAEPYLSESIECVNVIKPPGACPDRQREEMKEDKEKIASQRSSAVDGKKGMIIKTKDATREQCKKRKLERRKLRKKVNQKNKKLHKTELCSFWNESSTCTYKGKCYFAHGVNELKKRTRIGNFKTQACVDCTVGEDGCCFGSRCNYCHPGEAVRRVVGKTYFDIDYYKSLKIEFPNNNYPFGIYV